MKSVKFLLATLCAFVLAGCAAVVPMGSAENDSRAKTFAPVPDRASLYIYRNETFGFAVPMTVTVNDRHVGQTGAQTFFLFTLQPGSYSVASIAENTSAVNLQVERGKNYFVWQEVKMGLMMARTNLQIVSDEQGRKGVLESKLLAPNVPEAELLPKGVAQPVGGTTGKTLTPSPQSSIAAPSNAEVAERLKKLQDLYDGKLITEREYMDKRRELLQLL